MFLGQKRTRKLKGGVCADGRKQKIDAGKEDYSAPIFAIEKKGFELSHKLIIAFEFGLVFLLVLNLLTFQKTAWPSVVINLFNNYTGNPT